MISFKEIEPGIYKMKSSGGKKSYLELIPRKSVTRKFDIVASCITEMSKVLGESFDQYIFELLSKYRQYKNNEEKIDFLGGESDFIAGYANIFVDKNGVDYYTLFYDKEIAQVSSFPYEVKKIIQMSVALKICSLLLNSPEGLSEDYYRKDGNQPEASFGAANARRQIIRVLEALNEPREEETTPRIIKTESGRVFFLVLPLKRLSLYEEVDLVEVSRRIIGLLPTLEYDRDPIPLFLGVIKNVRKGKWQNYLQEAGIEYVDNLEGKIHFSWDEQIGVADKLSQLAQTLESELIKGVKNSPKRKSSIEKDLALQLLNKRLKEIKHASPYWRFVTVPLIAKVFGIRDKSERKKLERMYPKGAALLSFHIGKEFRTLFPKGYSYVLEFANCFAVTEPPWDTKWSLHSVSHFINTTLKLTNSDLMEKGFGSRIDFARFVERFVGVMRRTNLCYILTGQEVKIDVPRLEKEATEYFFDIIFTDLLNDSKLDQLRYCI